VPNNSMACLQEEINHALSNCHFWPSYDQELR